MKCTNCGAEYADNLDRCPYCERANDVLANKRYDEAVKAIKANKKRINDIPKTVPRSASKVILRVAAIALAAVIILVGMIVGISKAKANKSERAIKDNLAKMESYIDKQDYAALLDLFDSIKYEADYSKYWQVAFLYNNYNIFCSFLEIEGAEEFAREYLIKVHRIGERYLNDRYRYATDEDIRIIMDMTDSEYMRMYNRTEEDIAELLLGEK